MDACFGMALGRARFAGAVSTLVGGRALEAAYAIPIERLSRTAAVRYLYIIRSP
jgi:hypothetical protein